MATISGRPTKLTPEVHVKIIDALKMGNYIEIAAGAAGVTRKSVYNWIARGKAAKERTVNGEVEPEELIYINFAAAAERAISVAEQRNLAIIAKASLSDWKAAAWQLERRFPDRWSRKERLDFKGNMRTENVNREEIVLEQRITSDPESVELLKQLYRRQAALIENGTIINP